MNLPITEFEIKLIESTPILDVANPNPHTANGWANLITPRQLAQINQFPGAKAICRVEFGCDVRSLTKAKAKRLLKILEGINSLAN